MLDVSILNADPDLSPSDFSDLCLLVSPEKRKRIERYRFFRDARNSLLGDILVRLAVGGMTGLPNSRLFFGTEKNGKPFLLDHPHVHFNVSHTSHYVAVAVDDTPVGLDIESLSSDRTDIAKRFFAPDENEYILSCPAERRPRAFYEIWTKKESFTKWDGSGLSKPLTSFSVLNTQPEGLHYYLVFENEEAICHVCTRRQAPPACSLLTVADLLARVARFMG